MPVSHDLAHFVVGRGKLWYSIGSFRARGNVRALIGKGSSRPKGKRMILQGTPKAYFLLNVRSTSLSPSRVHQILHEMVRRVGISRCGEIGYSLPERDGRYALAFMNREAADVFERLCADAGTTPRRLHRQPAGLRLLDQAGALAAELATAAGLIVLFERLTDPRYSTAHLN